MGFHESNTIFPSSHGANPLMFAPGQLNLGAPVWPGDEGSAVQDQGYTPLVNQAFVGVETRGNYKEPHFCF